MFSKSVLRHILFKNKISKSIWTLLSTIKSNYFLRYNPKVIANNTYKAYFKKNINWKQPTDLIEKIQWLQLYTDTSLWTICSDKYLVRQFVEGKGLGELLNPLYGNWTNVNNINYAVLPSRFALKSNHSCGQVILVENKNKLDKVETNRKLKKWLRTRYGYSSAQLHYLKIKPRILAEKLIEKAQDQTSLIDYKIWCFHGKPECVLVVFNRTSENYSLSLFDLEWNNISERAFNKTNKHYSGSDIEKPASFETMIEASKKLSKDFPQVRIDFYDVNNTAVFGEMTFTTGFGYFNKEFYNYLGGKIDLNEVSKLPKMNKIN